MARKRLPSKLHLLSVRELQTAGEGDHADGGGLLLRVRGDNAAWVFRYTAATGKRREMGLGTAHRANPAQAGQSLTSARELAAAARQQLQQGIDPIDERDRRRSAERAAKTEEQEQRKRQAITLARAARDYHERVIEPSRTDKHAAQWISSLENHMPAELWKAPLGAVTAPQLLDVLIGIYRKVPETAMRIRQRLESVFEDAMFRGLCGTNPAAAVKRKLREIEVRRDRGAFAALPYPDAPAFVVKLRGLGSIAARCLEFAMLTAARTGEAIGAEWTEFDLQARLWVVPGERMKKGEPHTVYLSDAALRVLQKMKGLHERWVFPSPLLESDKPLSNMAMLTLLDRMKMRDKTTVHGLCRSTFSTWANETGAARPDVIEACLAHEEADRVRAAYNRAQFAAERRALLAAWADFLAGKAPARAEPTPAANVVDFRAAA